jgi:hypothetical protein
VPVPARVPTPLRGKVFRGSEAIANGLLTPNQLRGPAWRPLFRDVYAEASVPVTHRLRAVAAAGLLIPGAVVSGLSAAVLWGVELAGPADDVELTLPAGAHARRVPGLRVRRVRTDPGEITTRRGTQVTTPELTAIRVASVLPGDEAVVALDRLVVAGVVGLDAARARAAAPGVGTPARVACARADDLAQSPQETRLRLLLRRHRIPEPVAQFVSATTAGSSRASTSPGRSARWRSSTTGSGMPRTGSSRGTASVSTDCAKPDGPSCS